MAKEKRNVTLKLVRGAKGKTQKDIANALNAMGRDASQSFISKLEKGLWSPTVELAFDLAVAYEVSFLDIIKALGFETELDQLQVEMDKSKVLQA
jgi:transcriptional regulator with XRE-family HTH domain